MVWKEGDMTFPRSAKKYNVEEIAQCNKNDVILVIEAVQQSKIGQKRKADGALNPKRRNIFGTKSNCGTASIVVKKRPSKHAIGQVLAYAHFFSKEHPIFHVKKAIVCNEGKSDLEEVCKENNIEVFVMKD